MLITKCQNSLLKINLGQVLVMQKATTFVFIRRKSIGCSQNMYRFFSLLITLFFITYTQVCLAYSSSVLEAKIDIQSLSKALDSYQKEFGRYPTTEEGLVVLTKDLIVDPACEIKKTGFIFRLPPDPWGNEYQYLSPGSINSSSYDIWSYGADGVKGGDGLNSDCGNWESDECNKIRSRKRSGDYYTPILYLSLFGLVLGFPIYLFKFIVNWKTTGNLRASLGGFHLGVLIYLIFVLAFLGAIAKLVIN